jgi:hypothetical protein
MNINLIFVLETYTLKTNPLIILELKSTKVTLDDDFEPHLDSPKTNNNIFQVIYQGYPSISFFLSHHELVFVLVLVLVIVLQHPKPSAT